LPGSCVWARICKNYVFKLGFHNLWNPEICFATRWMSGLAGGPLCCDPVRAHIVRLSYVCPGCHAYYTLFLPLSTWNLSSPTKPRCWVPWLWGPRYLCDANHWRTAGVCMALETSSPLNMMQGVQQLATGLMIVDQSWFCLMSFRKGRVDRKRQQRTAVIRKTNIKGSLLLSVVDSTQTASVVRSLLILLLLRLWSTTPWKHKAWSVHIYFYLGLRTFSFSLF
jgi:hypothetical protein